MKDINNFILEKLKITKDSKNDNRDPDDPKTWVVGDILVCQWGYSMVIVDFYKIIKTTGKSFVLRKLKDKKISGDGWRGECVPIENEFEKNEQDINVRINKYNYVKIKDKGHCSLWTGNPVHYDHMD